MSRRFTVLGDGAMGTACALVLASNPEHEVTIWCQFSEQAQALRTDRENRRFLPGVKLDERIAITDDFATANAADGYVVAIPTIYVAKTLERLAGHFPSAGVVVSVVKGIEQETLRTPSQIIADKLGADRPIVVLSGPSHAEEVARGLPASVTAAAPEAEAAIMVQRWFNTRRFRVYTAPDRYGTELAAALKNVIAIAAGVCDGLGFGDNTKSALMTRGLVEMIRFGVALGAQRDTFYGLAGIGDLITTCVSPHGRNRKVGELLGKGETLQRILDSTPQVAEGVWTSRSVRQLAQQRQIDMPVTEEIYQVLFEGKNPRDAVDALMSREPKAELQHD